MRTKGPHGLDPWECEKLAKKRGLFDRSTLPNQDGYKFHGFGIDGWRYNCEIRKNEKGSHYITGEAGYKEIVGWKPIETKATK